MAEITASLVKELRDKTGAGMMDCKKALTETGGDVEAAVDWLRKKGVASAAKKASRVAAEGLVGVAVDGARGALVEVNSETDFVARNPEFQQLVSDIAGVALAEGGDLDRVLKAPYPGVDKNVADQVTEIVGRIGENMVVRRAAGLSVGTGVVAQYIHNAVTPGLGKIGVLVALESTGDAEKLSALGKQIAMHVAAAKPEAVTTADIDPTALQRERDVLSDQARASGKPDNIIEKMVEGRLRKYYEEVVLTEQIFVIDGETKVGKVVEQAAADIGAPVKIAGFVSFVLGEGVEKEETDFAAEVAAQVGG
ncbi:MAG: elongation factor Ts [Rhodospirillaceae bacterium]|nr:elongation factor Ts [Rhodospirillaceae bacterium]|tara:strand:- start:723 stop:1649 length:927 start_codon:yes stop_codon:yes gene_type:complete